MEEERELYKYGGFWWKICFSTLDIYPWFNNNPLCPTADCFVDLELVNGKYYCPICNKEYLEHSEIIKLAEKAQKKWNARERGSYKLYSLDLPPTKVADESSDENYWVQARLGEKNGKRMAVIYFGEKLKGKQNKKDYVQTFVDIEDEQLRFDKSNKNPMKLLSKLIAEFPNSTIEVKRKKGSTSSDLLQD